jgi:hypothetical protein
MNRVRISRTEKYPAGEYYVGDLCYVLDRHDKGELELWGVICSKFFPKNGDYVTGDFELNGMRYSSYGTMYGDGSYHDQEGHAFAVDSGTIGVVSIEHVDRDAPSIHGGNIIQFEKDFTTTEKDGVITIGHLHINTEYEDDICDECGYDYCDGNGDCYDDEVIG